MASVEDGSYIAAADAARLLGVTRQRVHTLWKGGKLPGVRVGHRVFLEVRAVEARASGDTADGRLTVRRIADRLGVTQETVRRWHEQGLLRGGIRANGRWTFPPDVLDGFVRPVVGVRARQQPSRHRA
jgi:hypothetical protein